MEAPESSRSVARLVPTTVENLVVKNPTKPEENPHKSYLPHDLPSITLEHGETFLGRGPLTQIQDVRLSRKQLIIYWDKHAGRATIQATGMNPSYLHAKGQREGTAITKESGMVEIGDGVVISLLPGLYGYMLQIGDQDRGIVPSITNFLLLRVDWSWLTIRYQDPPESKRKLHAVSTETSDAGMCDESTSRYKKKRRVEESTEPPKDADTILLSSVSDAYKAAVGAVREVLPDKPIRAIITTLVKCHNNIEQTIDMLLASVVVDGPEATTLLPPITSSSPGASFPLPALPPTAPVTPTKVETSTLSKTPAVSPLKALDEDENIAAELQKALDAAAEQEAKAKRAEEEAKSQMEIIKMLVQEKESMEVKSKELASIKMELDKLYLPGEREALEGTEMRTFTLMPSRGFANDASEMHYRTAESQFHRLCESMTGVKVTRVDYIVNPPLVKAFERKRLQLAEHLEWEDTKPILAFHGTSEENIAKICKNNFDFSKIGASTGNMGFYGKGVYFSEYASYSIPYVRGGTKLLLCKVLVGHSFRMSRVETGKPQEEGYDSHISPCGRELVIFDPDQILPTYVIHYTTGSSTRGFGSW